MILNVGLAWQYWWFGARVTLFVLASLFQTSFAICISSKSLCEFQYWWITYSHIMKRDPTSNVMTETQIGRLWEIQRICLCRLQIKVLSSEIFSDAKTIMVA